MRQIVVISGKGGTGKTILTASLAALAKNKVMVDCDVDASDLHLLLEHTLEEKHEFWSGKTAKIDNQLCERCGQCVSACRFNAIDENFIVDPVDCEGCGFCSNICPADAISMEENLSGEWFASETRYGPFVHAKLGIAEENSGKLVARIREAAKEIAEKKHLDYIIIDGPPGIGCSVIASMSGIDLALIVTEPTLSGMHDMQRVYELTEHFGVTAKVVINKFDLNMKNTENIQAMCDEKDIEVVGLIPYSSEVSRSIVNCKPLVEFTDSHISEIIASIWTKIAATFS